MAPRRSAAAAAAACALAASILIGSPVHGFAPSSGGRAAAAGGTTTTTTTSSSRLDAEKVATFGMGCFWAPSETMLKTSGVKETIAGYTGNPSHNGRPPKYDDVCFSRQWVEGVRVTYDDSVVSYNDLLDAFFDAQEPKYGSRQYGSMIFPGDEDQTREANEWLRSNTDAGRTREKDGLPAAMTSIEPASTFYAAEGYHQKYWEKWRVRFGAVIVLLAVASGALEPILPADDPELVQKVETIANALCVGGGLLALVERGLDAKVVEMK